MVHDRDAHRRGVETLIEPSRADIDRRDFAGRALAHSDRRKCTPYFPFLWLQRGRRDRKSATARTILNRTLHRILRRPQSCTYRWQAYLPVLAEDERLGHVVGGRIGFSVSAGAWLTCPEVAQSCTCVHLLCTNVFFSFSRGCVESASE